MNNQNHSQSHGKTQELQNKLVISRCYNSDKTKSPSSLAFEFTGHPKIILEADGDILQNCCGGLSSLYFRDSITFHPETLTGYLISCDESQFSFIGTLFSFSELMNVCTAFFNFETLQV